MRRRDLLLGAGAVGVAAAVALVPEKPATPDVGAIGYWTGSRWAPLAVRLAGQIPPGHVHELANRTKDVVTVMYI